MMKLIAHTSQEPFTITPEGGTRRVLSYGGGIMLVEFTFEAGVTTLLHSHPHEQIGYVVEGELELLLEDLPPTRLSTGSSYYVPPNLRHCIVTLGPCVLVDCFTPIREDFVLVKQALSTDCLRQAD